MTRLEQLAKLVQLHPYDPLSHYGLGLEYMNLQRWDEAAAAFAQAVAVDPKYSAAYYHQGRALISAGHHDVARAVLAAGLESAKAARDWHTQSEMEQLLESIA